MELPFPAAMLRRAIGDDAFELFQRERGAAESYALTPVQARPESIARITISWVRIIYIPFYCADACIKL